MSTEQWNITYFPCGRNEQSLSGKGPFDFLIFYQDFTQYLGDFFFLMVGGRGCRWWPEDFFIKSIDNNMEYNSGIDRRAKLIWSDREISSSQNLPPKNPTICLRQFFQCCDSCSVLSPSSFRRLHRLEFCPRIFTDGFAVWILPPTGSLFGASGAKKLQLYLLEPSAREFASGLKICPRRSSLHFSSVLHPWLR